MLAGTKLPFERYLIHPPKPPNDVEKPQTGPIDLERASSFAEQAPPKRKLFNRTASEAHVKTNVDPERNVTPNLAEETPKKPTVQTPSGDDSTQPEQANQISRHSIPPTTQDQPADVQSSKSNINTDSSHTPHHSSSHTSLPSNSHPLHEVSPNTSPRRSPAKRDVMKISTQNQLPKSSFSTTANVISNHLAALRRPSIAKSSSDPTLDKSRPPSSQGRPPSRPTKRKLFGRATSNLSAKSAGSADFSRAGSVDTMNSEGMGTPLEASLSIDANAKSKTNDTSFATTRSKETKSSALADFLKNLQAGAEEVEREEERLATQIVYDEPEAKAWRDKIVGRMRGQKGKVDAETRKVEEMKGGVIDESIGTGTGRRTRRSGR